MKTIGEKKNPKFKVLISCPPMLLSADRYSENLRSAAIQAHCPQVSQIIPEEELIELVPSFDGWIIGDDPATSSVFAAGAKGCLRAAVKWGIGVDNVDFEAATKLNIQIANTPGMFSHEVADVAYGYLIMLSRHLTKIHDGVCKGNWPKPVGTSLQDKTIGIVGFGNIGREIANRALVSQMRVFAYDPRLTDSKGLPSGCTNKKIPDGLKELDYLVFACSLTPENYHLCGNEFLSECKPGLRIVNVSRGPLIDENALIQNLKSGFVTGVALDVFENEPLSLNSPLRSCDNVIFGSHNGSNTQEAVDRTSQKAINLISEFLR